MSGPDNDSRDPLERAAEELRRSGIDGGTFARRILALLPHLPQEADGDVWRAARAMRSMDISNEELVEIALELARDRKRAGGGPEGR